VERIERRVELAAGPAEVWDAVTEELSQWFGAVADLRPQPGSRATFRWPDGRERQAVVEAAERERLLAFRWLPFERLPGGATVMVGPGRVELTLARSGRSTVLTVTEWAAAPAPLAGGAGR
jgi:uncharacterized protein YndB with AHSA1/START domain